MIISKTPFRMSFVGGGSDLPSHYLQHGGAVLSTSIDKYMYVSIHENFDSRIKVSYSVFEDVKTIEDVKHPIVKNALKLMNISGIEITSSADIPARGSGLGSSSSYTVGLCNCLSNYLDKPGTKEELAELACKIEIELCGEPIGKQDQYAAAYGGINRINFNTDGSVLVRKLTLNADVQKNLEESTLFFYVGTNRSARSILTEQDKRTRQGKNTSFLNEMVSLVKPFEDALIDCDISEIGRLMRCNWKLKKELSSGVSNSLIDEAYAAAIENGAKGGKLLGAGSGGFLCFFVEKECANDVRVALSGLREIPLNYDQKGTNIIYRSQ